MCCMQIGNYARWRWLGVGNLVPRSRSGKKVKNASVRELSHFFQTADLVYCSDRDRFAGLRTACELVEKMLTSCIVCTL